MFITTTGYLQCLKKSFHPRICLHSEILLNFLSQQKHLFIWPPGGCNPLDLQEIVNKLHTAQLLSNSTKLKVTNYYYQLQCKATVKFGYTPERDATILRERQKRVQTCESAFNRHLAIEVEFSNLLNR